jgi:hypothetical protein
MSPKAFLNIMMNDECRMMNNEVVLRQHRAIHLNHLAGDVGA